MNDTVITGTPISEEDWLSISGLLFGDLVDAQGVEQLAQRLQRMREDITLDTVPQINSLEDAHRVHGMLLYRINVLTERKEAHRASARNMPEPQSPITRRMLATARVHPQRTSSQDILKAVEILIAEYNRLKQEVDQLENRMLDSDKIDTINILLLELFDDDPELLE